MYACKQPPAINTRAPCTIGSISGQAQFEKPWRQPLQVLNDVAPSKAHVSILAAQRRRSVAKTRAHSVHHEDANIHPAKIGPNVLSGLRDLKSNLKFGPATVIRNDPVNLDGSIRLIHLSIAEHVDMLYGVRVKGVPDAPRWIHSYTMPGQFVALKLPGGKVARRLYSLASSPYASRRDSAYFDASIVEIVAEKHAEGGDSMAGDIASNSGSSSLSSSSNGGSSSGSSLSSADSCLVEELADDCALAELGPGSQLEVSQVVGRGFAPLLSSSWDVMTAMEAGRPLLLIAVGTRGLVPLRAMLNWTPVLAHATAHPVSAFYLAQCPMHAAFLTEWDAWREAGIRFTPVYTGSFDPDQDPAAGAAAAAATAAAAAATPSAAIAGTTSPGAQQQQAASAAAGAGHGAASLEALESALFLRDGGLASLCGPRGPSDCVVLMSGVSGDVASALARRLWSAGVPHDNMLFADYF